MSEETRFDFPLSFQNKILGLMLRDAKFAVRVNDLLEPSYFSTEEMTTLARIIRENVKKHRSPPDVTTLIMIIKDEIAAKRIRKDMAPDLSKTILELTKTDLTNPGYVQDKVLDFAKHQAMEQAIISSVGMLEKGDFKKIEQVMKAAINVGSVEQSEDYDYFEQIRNRSAAREDEASGKITRNGITTGYPLLDSQLYHRGWGRKELSCMMAPAKGGKSMSLGDFGKNASLAGYNVGYWSLEVSKEIIADRIDANLSSTMMKDLVGSHASVEAAILAAGGKAGKFKLRDLPSGTMKPSHLMRMIERHRDDGIVMDMVIVDYADIMAAEYRSDKLQDNLREIYIDLRAIAWEYNVALLTATQTNREGAKAVTAKATDVGDDWNKARTVDLMIGISATDEEKKKGLARLSFLLSRNTQDGLVFEIQQDRQRMRFIEKILGVR